MPLNKFISVINSHLSGMVPGMQVYGIAETVQRGSDIIPAIVNASGDYKYVGVDDIESIIIYHRVGAVTISRSTQRGTGDDPNDYTNRYVMGMVVYMDMKRTGLLPDELLLYLQARMPGELRMEPYRSAATITFNNVILNGQTVWNAEYGNQTPFKLPAERTLMQINYTIESRVKPSCFEKCPEVCA